MTYALGRRVEPSDMPAVRKLIKDAGKRGYKVSAFVQALVTSPMFTNGRAADAATTTNVAVP